MGPLFNTQGLPTKSTAMQPNEQMSRWEGSCHDGPVSLPLERKTRNYIFHFHGNFFDIVVCMHWLHLFLSSVSWLLPSLAHSCPIARVFPWDSPHRCFSVFSLLDLLQHVPLLTTAYLLKCALPLPALIPHILVSLLSLWLHLLILFFSGTLPLPIL